MTEDTTATTATIEAEREETDRAKRLAAAEKDLRVFLDDIMAFYTLTPEECVRFGASIARWARERTAEEEPV